MRYAVFTIWLFIFSMSITSLAYAQPAKYRFTRISSKEGLSHNQVNCVIKDENGFIWMGTMSGLNRYDGYECKVYLRRGNDAASLRDNFINAIFAAPQGMLWINTPTGATLYNTRLDQFDTSCQQWMQRWQLPAGNVAGIQKDDAGNYWFLISGRLYQYRNTTAGIPARTDSLQVTVQQKIAAFTLDKKNHIWLLYTNGLLEGRDIRQHRLYYSSTRCSRILSADTGSYLLYADGNDNLWIAASSDTKGVYRVRTTTETTITHFAIPHIVKGITEDAAGKIWIGTDHGGIHLVDNRTRQVQYLLNNPEDDKSLSQNSITALYKDEVGVIWLGTYKQGCCYYNENMVSFPVIKHRRGQPGSLPYDDVNRFAEDSKGNIWIGTNGGGLIYYNTTSNTYTQYRHNPADAGSLCNDVIVSLAIDHQQRLWIGTFYGGLDCFDGRHFIHYRHEAGNSNSVADNNIWEILESSDQYLWIGTISGGVDRMDPATHTFHHYPTQQANSVGSAYVPAIMEDNRHRLWFGTEKGIDRLDPLSGKFTHYNHLPNNFIISLMQDSRGLIWAGTGNGLYLLYAEDAHVLAALEKEDGLPDNTILNLLEDNRQTIWLSTPNGLCNIAVEQVDGKWTFRYKNYNELNNLQARAFNENAALKLRNGVLLFGGPEGFNMIDPERIPVVNTRPAVVLTDLQVFNKSLSVGEKLNGHIPLYKSISHTDTLRLRYKENDFSIEFAELGFAQSDKDEYAYWLEGFNKGWVLTNGAHRRATYTNLNAGTYIFHVKAGDGNGGWNTRQAALTIIIDPPFWKTPLAFVLYILFIIAILIIARRITVDRERMRFTIEQQQKEADRMHALDMMKIRFFTNVSHEFRTPLSLILSPLETMGEGMEGDKKKQLHLVQRNARRLLNLVNQLLDFRKLETQEFRLTVLQGDIISFIRETAFSFSDIAEKKDISFAFYTDLHAFETLFDKDKLEKIIFNLLSNAFKFTPRHGSIEVRVTASAADTTQILTIQVNDTGIGIAPENQEQIFEHFFQSDTSDAVINQGSGIGLSITREFVKLHGGNISVASEPGKGSCFTITLPLQPVGGVVTAAQPAQEDISIATWQEEEVVIIEREEKRPATINKSAAVKETILLAEDNEDFRFYLKDNLKNWFYIIEAANGREACQQLERQHPDLVVTDIMMPLMNGLELARKIRTDPRTSHIPVVLLTAMATEEQQLEGFETGANDYITKPFNFEILLSRLKSLLQQRSQVRKEFQKKLEINPAEIAVTPLDEQFMQQTLAIVERNISNPDFSVEELSRNLYMSRVALYKKLLALTGKTPIEFIRIMRMKRAASLLTASQQTVAEIAYEVGFNNPKYFARYFKEEFGVLPSQYRSGRQ